MKENDLYVKSEKYKCKIGKGEFSRVIIKLNRIFCFLFGFNWVNQVRKIKIVRRKIR